MRQAAPPHRQQGVTLVISIIFLLMLSMIGLWSATNNGLQERMAGNSRSRDLALEAAEAALKYAENSAATWRTSPFDGSAKGLLTYDATLSNDAVYWRDANRWTNALQVPAGTVNQVAAQPYYVIEKMPSVGTVEYYRITAKGIGGESSSLVILQSIISYAP
jgi:type IV pilus assembly protein PilX